jgi:hypothetical protein
MGIIKKAIFDAEFQSVEKGAKKVHPQNSYRPKIFHTVIKVKNSIFLSLFS